MAEEPPRWWRTASSKSKRSLTARRSGISATTTNNLLRRAMTVQTRRRPARPMLRPARQLLILGRRPRLTTTRPLKNFLTILVRCSSKCFKKWCFSVFPFVLVFLCLYEVVSCVVFCVHSPLLLCFGRGLQRYFPFLKYDLWTNCNFFTCLWHSCWIVTTWKESNLQGSSFSFLVGGRSYGRYAIVETDELRLPIQMGWRREITVREYSKSGIRGDVLYYAPCGKKFKQYPDIMRVSL